MLYSPNNLYIGHYAIQWQCYAMLCYRPLAWTILSQNTIWQKLVFFVENDPFPRIGKQTLVRNNTISCLLASSHCLSSHIGDIGYFTFKNLWIMKCVKAFSVLQELLKVKLGEIARGSLILLIIVSHSLLIIISNYPPLSQSSTCVKWANMFRYVMPCIHFNITMLI